MKLVTYRYRSAVDRVGMLLDDDQIVALTMDGAPTTLLEILRNDSLAAAAEAATAALRAGARRPLPLAEVELRAPVPRPNSIRDCMAFERHLINCMRTVARWKFAPIAALDRCAERMLGRGFLRPAAVWYRQPIYYKGNPDTVVGGGADVCWPSYAEKLDFELEFGVFIGKQGKNIAASQASESIAGFCYLQRFQRAPRTAC